MHAGTEAQEDYLKQYKAEHNIGRLDYEDSVNVLKEVNLYEDNGYKYGTGWLYRPIPQEDLDLIISILNDTY